MHRRWLLDPPKKKPERSDYDLFGGIDPEQVKAGLAAVRKVVDGWELDLSRLEKSERQPILDGVHNFMAELSITQDEKWQAAARSIGYTENLIQILDKERHFKKDLENWKQYKNWEQTRNPARAALEAKHGFDTKHAAHVVRLQRQGRELLETGKINVWRGDTDREELLAIRNGAWAYDQLIEWFDAQDAEINEIYRSKSYVVPHKPQRKKIEQLCVELVQEALGLT